MLGQPIHVKELSLPEGVRVLESAEAVVVQLKLPGAEAVVAATPAMPGATAAEPEIIKKEKKAEEPEEK